MSEEYNKLSDIIHVMLLQNNAKKSAELAKMNMLLNQPYNSSIDLIGELDLIIGNLASLHSKNAILFELNQNGKV